MICAYMLHTHAYIHIYTYIFAPGHVDKIIYAYIRLGCTDEALDQLNEELRDNYGEHIHAFMYIYIYIYR